MYTKKFIIGSVKEAMLRFVSTALFNPLGPVVKRKSSSMVPQMVAHPSQFTYGRHPPTKDIRHNFKSTYRPTSSTMYSRKKTKEISTKDIPHN